MYLFGESDVKPRRSSIAIRNCTCKGYKCEYCDQLQMYDKAEQDKVMEKLRKQEEDH